MGQADECRRRAMDLARRNDHAAGLKVLGQLAALATKIPDKQGRLYVSECVDSAVQALTNMAFQAPYRDKQRVLAGTDAIQLQLSCSAMEFPYTAVSRRTHLNALKALTSITESTRPNSSELSTTDTAFRILQRLITGVGVRHANDKSYVAEKEFNMVLNAYANGGRMDMAGRVVTLQQTVRNAPPLSPVTYSILLKGHGRLGNLVLVDQTMQHAVANKIDPDTVMINSLIDAYVNCNAIDKALAVFEYMKNPTGGSTATTLFSTAQQHNFCPRPNRRTYNTILKGLANSGALQEALTLSNEIKSFRMWDAVTTNTLVHAAVLANDFDLAKDILSQHTVQLTAPLTGKHPNVEAYTELLDRYAKDGQLEQALSILQLMRKRGVEPNEITYTCLIGGLGRHKRLNQAKKMLVFMATNGFRPQAVTYNALISGLVGVSERGWQDEPSDNDGASTMDTYVDESLKLLREMMQKGVRPNAITASVLVYAMGKCQPPRIREAKSLVDKLERSQMLDVGQTKVVTALVQTCGIGGDLNGALDSFRKLQERPDVVAVNAFLDACCRCNREELALETFDYYFRRSRAVSRLRPDVISYSVLISALLKKGEAQESREQAVALYREMKSQNKIFPDTTLVDIILKGMVRISRASSSSISKVDVHFLANVLRDAEKLPWEEGEFQLRERTVRIVAGERLREVWKKYGWNDVDSSFRII